MAVDTTVRTERPAAPAPMTARPGAVVRELLLRTQRRAIVGWSLALAAVAGIYVSFYPAIGEEQMADMATMIPEDLAVAMGYDRMGDAAGYLTSTVFGLLGPALLLVCAIGLGARLIAGAEEDGSLELEFAAAVPRRTIYLERLLALVAQLVVLTIVLWAATALLVVGLGIDATVGGVLAGSVGLLVFVLLHGTLAYALGAATGRRGLAIGIAAATAVAGYIGNAIGPMVSGAGWLQTVSPWHWYLAGDPVSTGRIPGSVVVLALVTVAVAAVGWVRFARRDLLV
jgi:ABC-2 type transport system permease protein